MTELPTGWERQRVAVARALLKDAPIVLPDEAAAPLVGRSSTACRRLVGR